MRKQILYGLLISAGAFALASCSDDFTPGGSAKGKINPLVNIDLEARDALPTVSRATADAITAEDLHLRLVPDDPTQSPMTWNSVTEFNNNEEISVGNYTLEAYYGTPGEEGFNKPYYYGSAAVTVRENEVTNVSLPVSLGNSMVSVTTTDAFNGYFTAASFALMSETSAAEVAYPLGSTEAVYMNPGTINLYADVTKPNGVSGRIQAAVFTASPKCHYTVNVDVNNGSVGAAVLTVTFSDDLDGEEVIEIELSDELFAVSAPTVKVTGYDSAETYSYIAGVVPAGLEPEMMIQAPGSIKSIKMTSQSVWLTSMGIPAELDLVAMPDETYTKLKGLGMLGEYHRVDKLARINLTELLKNIAYVNGEDNTTRIAFQVTDKNNKVSEPVVFEVEVINVEASIASVGGIGEGSSEMDIVVSYNGTNFSNDVAIQYANDRGTWSNAEYTITSTASRAESRNYTLHLTGLPTTDAITLRLVVGGSSVETKVVPRADFSAQVDERDVFATTALVTLSSSSIDASTAVFSGLPAGAAATLQEGTTYKITGLTPATAYSLQAKAGGIFCGVSFTTEAATQLPNAGMETWTETDSGSYWELLYPGESAAGSSWGTNNPMTTSQGASYAYCRISGTISTTDSRSGNAALIRTVGWGSGNTATGSSGSSGKTKYIDAGLLHLGSSRSTRPSGYSDQTGPIGTTDLDCGIAFASRPSSLSFWYKYSPKNSSDNGYAEITVYDGSGNEIAKQTVNLGSQGSYVQQTIELSYPAKAAKAAKIYVKFLSTNSESFLVKSDSNLSGPGFANLSRGTYMGSQLYIDDITLNY